MRPFAQPPLCGLPSPRIRGASRSAFSMVELVIVVLVMGILAAVAVPTFVDSLLFHRVESAARRVKADLELARRTARLTSASQTITFSGKTYTASAAVKDLDRPSQNYTVNLAKSPYKLTTVTADFGGSAFVSFDGYATPSAGGTVVLQTDNNHKCVVTLDGTTGQVTINSNHSRGRTAQVAGN